MISYSFKGKLIAKKLETFSGRESEVVKCTVVLSNTDTTESGYTFTDTIAAETFGDRAERLNEVKEGSILNIRGGINSREYNGKYYTSANIIEFNVIEEPKDAQPEAKPTAKPKAEKKVEPTVFDAPQSKDDLPF